MNEEFEYTTPEVKNKKVVFKIKGAGEEKWKYVKITENEMCVMSECGEIQHIVKEGKKFGGVEVKNIVEVLKRERINHPRIFIGGKGHEYALTMMNHLEDLLPEMKWELVKRDLIFRKIAYVYFATNYGEIWLRGTYRRREYGKNLLKDYLRVFVEKIMYYPPNREMSVLKSYEPIENGKYFVNLLDLNKVKEYENTNNVRIAYKKDRYVVILRGTNTENIMNVLDMVGKNLFSKLTVRNMKDIIIGDNYYRLFVVRDNVMKEDAPFFREFKVEDSVWEFGRVKKMAEEILGNDEMEVWDFEL